MANGENQIPESAQEARERARRAAGEDPTESSDPIDPDTEPIEPGPDGMGDDDPSGNRDGTQMDGMAGPPTQSGTQQAPAASREQAATQGMPTSEAPAEAQESIEQAREQAAQGPEEPVVTPASQRTPTETAPEFAEQNIQQSRQQAERVATQEGRDVVEPETTQQDDGGPREAVGETVEAFEQEADIEVPGEGPIAQPTGREPTEVDPDEQFGAFEATEDFERGIGILSEAFAQIGGDIGEGAVRLAQAGPGVGAASVRSRDEIQSELRDQPAESDVGRTIERVGRGTGEAPGQLLGEATILSEAPEFAVAAGEDVFAGEGGEFASEATQAAINRAVLAAGSAIRNPARTAGNILGGALISGGAAAASGRAVTAGSLRAELDPRVGTFGDVTDRARDVRDRFRGDGDGDGDGTTADGDGGPSPVEGPVGEAPGRGGDATAATLGEGDADPTPGVQDRDGAGPDVFGDADGDAPDGGATAGAGPRADVGPDRDAPSQEMGQPGTAGQLVEQRQRPDQMDLSRQRQRTRQRDTDPTVDMDDLSQELERMARERTRGGEPRRVFAPTAEVDIRDPGITRLQRRATRPQARVDGTGPAPVLTDYAATIAGTLGATDAEAVALARTAQDPTVDQPTDTFGGVDTDQPVDIDQPIDVDQPGDVDVDQPTDIDTFVGPDTDQPGDIDQPTDVDQPVDVDIGQPVDTDRRRDRDIDPDPDPDPDDDEDLRLLQEDFLGDDPAPATQFTERQFTVAFADPSDVLGI